MGNDNGDQEGEALAIVPATGPATAGAAQLSSPKATGKRTGQLDIEKESLGPEDVTNFEAHGKKVRFAARSLYLFSEASPLRQRCVWIVLHKRFDQFILFLIILNSITLALVEFAKVDSANVPVTEGSWRNSIIEITELPFTILFTLECVLKSIAMGFVMERGSYLRDPWNNLDFFVVVASIVATLPGMPNVSALRTFRVLRPLRSLTVVPGMKVLIESLLRSIPALMNVVALLAFVFAIFGIMGIQLWPGLLHARCRLTPVPVRLGDVPGVAEGARWIEVDDAHKLEVLRNPGAYACLPGTPVLGTQDELDAWPGPGDAPGKDESPWTAAQACEWPVDEAAFTQATDWPVCIDPHDADCRRAAGAEGAGADACPDDVDPATGAALANPCAVYANATHDAVRGYQCKASLVDAQGVWDATRCHWPWQENELEDDNAYRMHAKYAFSGAWGEVCALPADSSGFNQCPVGRRWCGSNWDFFGNARFTDPQVMDSGDFVDSLNFGYTSFDGIGQAILTIFQSITGEGWVDIMYQVQNAYAGTFAAIYFVVMIIFGSFFLLNLTLAVIWDEFEKNKDEDATMERLRVAQEAREEMEKHQKEREQTDVMDADGDGVIEAHELAALDLDGDGELEAHELAEARQKAALAGKFGKERQAAARRALLDKDGDGVIEAHELEEAVRNIDEGDVDAILGLGVDPKKRVAMTSFRADGYEYLYPPVGRLVDNKYFNNGVMVLIGLNTFTLSADKYPSTTSYDHALEATNFVLTLLFTIEMAMKLVGLGARGYVRDPFNTFDGVIVFISLVELIVAPPAFMLSPADVAAAGGGGGAVSAFRTFRLFRLFKLARSWTSLQELLIMIVKTLKDITNFAFLLLIFMYIFALVGMQFFANHFCFDPDTGRYIPFEERAGAAEGIFTCDLDNVPRSHFDDMLIAFTTIFQILTGENWNTVMYDGMRGNSYNGTIAWGAMVYFVFVTIVGNFIVLNLFLAILLGNFEDDGGDGDDDDEKKKTDKVTPLSAVEDLANKKKKKNKKGKKDGGGGSTVASSLGADQVSQVVQVGTRRYVRPAEHSMSIEQNTERLRSGKELGIGNAYHAEIEASLTGEPLTDGDATWQQAFDVEVKWDHDTNQVYIGRVRQGSHADKEGLIQSGDVVTAVNGQAVAGNTLPDVCKMILTEQPADGATGAAASSGGGGGALGSIPDIAEEGAEESTGKSAEEVRQAEAVAAAKKKRTEGAHLCKLTLVREHPAEKHAQAMEKHRELKPRPSQASRPSLSQRMKLAAKLSKKDVLAGGDGSGSKLGHGADEESRRHEMRRRSSSRKSSISASVLEGDTDAITVVIVLMSGQKVKIPKINRFQTTIKDLKMLIKGATNRDPSVQTLRLDGKILGTSRGSGERGRSMSIFSDVASAVTGSLDKKYLGTIGVKNNSEIHLSDLYGTSCYVLPTTNKNRQWLSDLVWHSYFDNTILSLIIFSSFLLAVDNPLDDKDAGKAQALLVLDYIMTTIFTMECVLKIASFGFLTHRGAYLKNGWNQLDFIIVIFSILSLSSNSPSMKSLRSLRTLRALRPLRMISRAPALKLVVNSMFRALPAIANVSLVCILFFLIFAIVAINSFKGRFNACGGAYEDWPADMQDFLFAPPKPADLTADQLSWLNATATLGGVCFDAATTTGPGADDITQQACEADGRTWAASVGDAYAAVGVEREFMFPNAGAPLSEHVCLWFGAEWDKVVPQSFDNIFASMGTLIELSTTEGWIDVMYAGTDATDPGMQPLRDNAQFFVVMFFILFEVVGCFFVVNLFVGVVIDNFNKMKDEMGDNFLLTDTQKQWVTLQRSMMGLRLKKTVKPPAEPARRSVWNFVRHRLFDIAIMACIVLNTFTMALSSFGQSTGKASFISVMNYLFAVIFTIEAGLKLYAYHWEYFKDSWNNFDFSIVVGTIFGIIMQEVMGSSAGSMATVIRIFRIGRIFRMVKSAKSLRMLFNTLMVTLPSMMNIAGFLFLLLFIYAIMGVQLFAMVQYGDTLNDHANFRSFWSAFVTLLRCATGENWNGLMYDIARDKDGCVANPAFDATMCGFGDELGCTPLNGCGGGWVTYLYFLTFTLGVTFVMVELFTAVILEGFGGESAGEDAPLTEEQMKQFVDIWSKFDGENTYYITAGALHEFLDELDPPMGFGKAHKASDYEMKSMIAGLNLAIYSGKRVFFLDVLHAIARSVLEKSAHEKGLEFDEVPGTHNIQGEWAKTFRNLGPTAQLLKEQGTVRSLNMDEILPEGRRGGGGSGSDDDKGMQRSRSHSMVEYYAVASIQNAFMAYKFRHTIDERVQQNKASQQESNKRNVVSRSPSNDISDSETESPRTDADAF